MMKLIQSSLTVFGLILLLVSGPLNAFESKLKLTGRNNLVISVENRQTVLELAENFLSTPEVEFLPLIASLEDPFIFKSATPVVVPLKGEQDIADKNTTELNLIHYEDAEALALSAASFTKKVRGTITRGDTSFLQLEGGTLLKAGTSFPVRLPQQAKDQIFKLSITEINSDGYTLQVGEATEEFKFINKSQSGSAIQLTNP
ncbi:MAG: hypothetical protein ACNA77_03910 [Opitutales bacterium]